MRVIMDLVLVLLINGLSVLKNIKFSDTKGLIRSRYSKKDNDQKRTKAQTLMYKTLHKNTKDRTTQS